MLGFLVLIPQPGPNPVPLHKCKVHRSCGSPHLPVTMLHQSTKAPTTAVLPANPLAMHLSLPPTLSPGLRYHQCSPPCAKLCSGQGGRHPHPITFPTLQWHWNNSVTCRATCEQSTGGTESGQSSTEVNGLTVLMGKVILWTSQSPLFRWVGEDLHANLWHQFIALLRGNHPNFVS